MIVNIISTSFFYAEDHICVCLDHILFEVTQYLYVWCPCKYRLSSQLSKSFFFIWKDSIHTVSEHLVQILVNVNKIYRNCFTHN